MLNAENEIKYGKFLVVAQTGLLLTYSIPQEYISLTKGTFCLLTVRKGGVVKKYVGVFLEFCVKPEFNCVPILGILPFMNVLSENLFSVLQWTADYYLTSIEKIISIVAPSFIWDVAKHQLLEKRLEKLKLNDSQLNNKKNIHKIKGEILLAERSEILLNEEQYKVYDSILTDLSAIYVLHGVTGSGKTEIYLKIAQYIIQQNKNVLILVPEIVLTPQMSARFRAVFKSDLAILHSGLTKVEYERDWFRVHYGYAKVVLGVRTAVFCSLENIGVIIVDEEHDGSYKSHEFPTYHARDIAVVRAKKENALCILGSATPSIESMYNVKKEKYKYLSLKNKFSGNQVESLIVDSKKELLGSYSQKRLSYATKSTQLSFQNNGISQEVCSLLRENKELGEQSIVIINRRGYVNFAICTQCSTPLSCPRCSVSTTLHEGGRTEICHYCNFKVTRRKTCLSCNGTEFLDHGIGTQNIEERIAAMIPAMRIARLDRDVLTSNSRVTEIIDDFRLGHTDCLVGTQMLAKGHDFPKVTLVVILHVEDALFLPDFRSSERTFQLLTQAMGRAGRGSKPGKVVLQSLILGHPIIEMSLKNDIEAYWEREMHLRQLGFHPPFSRQILCEIRHKNKETAFSMITKLKNYLIKFWAENNYTENEVRLAGPYIAALEKINNEFRVQLCISSQKKLHPAHLFPTEVFLDKEINRQILRIDVDPYTFL
ncbi:replication restart helicase PriA [Fluviispira vulneris]|uniref:replication restart helicase PriA n=1 Tax=Fluviispira vulneris TaxID=2763012 RepID=UPI001645FA63|nr:primosomal protein N' [Fluviispira vulneris]